MAKSAHASCNGSENRYNDAIQAAAERCAALHKRSDGICRFLHADPQKEEFVPPKPGEYRIYVCGPTVYNYIHIGNARGRWWCSTPCAVTWNTRVTQVCCMFRTSPTSTTS